jgi:hypothetical protein
LSIFIFAQTLIQAVYQLNGLIQSSGSITKTELFSHNSDVTRLPFYDAVEKKMLGMINPDSTPEEIADVIYEVATDNKDQLRYFAGKESQAIYNRRQEIGAEASRKELKNMYFAG